MAQLILHNDDKNSYQKVKASLIRWCDHETIQAEQCSLIAHNTGQCIIKNGDFMELLDIKNKFELVNIDVEIIQ